MESQLFTDIRRKTEGFVEKSSERLLPQRHYWRKSDRYRAEVYAGYESEIGEKTASICRVPLLACEEARDTAASITSRIFANSVGLSIDSVAPAARACSRRFSPKEVIATTGKSARSSSKAQP